MNKEAWQSPPATPLAVLNKRDREKHEREMVESIGMVSDRTEQKERTLSLECKEAARLILEALAWFILSTLNCGYSALNLACCVFT